MNAFRHGERGEASGLVRKRTSFLKKRSKKLLSRFATYCSANAPRAAKWPKSFLVTFFQKSNVLLPLKAISVSC